MNNRRRNQSKYRHRHNAGLLQPISFDKICNHSGKRMLDEDTAKKIILLHSISEVDGKTSEGRKLMRRYYYCNHCSKFHVTSKAEYREFESNYRTNKFNSKKS